MDTRIPDARTPNTCDHYEFDNIVRRYRPAIHRLARRLAPPGVEPEDLVQETFIRAYRGYQRFRGDCSAQSWLYRIAMNVIYSHHSKRGADPLSKGVLDDNDGTCLDAIPSVEDVEHAVVLRLSVAQALAELPEGSRQVLILRHLRGLEYAEIAVATGLPLGTVESRLFRARRKLRPLLESLPRATFRVDASLRSIDQS